MGGAQANQHRTDLVEQILTGQHSQQAPQGALLAHFGARLLDQRQGVGLHPLVNDGSLILSRAIGPEPRQQRLRQVDLQIFQFFRVQVKIGQLQALQAGVPQAFQRAGFPDDALALGRRQQSLTHGRRHIGLKAPGDVEFLDPPNQLAQGQGFHPVDQRHAQHLAPTDVPIAGTDQHGFGLKCFPPGECRVQIRIANSAGPVQRAKVLLGQIGANAGELLGRRQRLFERQVLITVQGIVMDEIQDRRLAGQHMVEMGDGLLDDLAWPECGPIGRDGRGHGRLLRQFGVKIALSCVIVTFMRAMAEAGCNPRISRPAASGSAASHSLGRKSWRSASSGRGGPANNWPRVRIA